MSMIFKVDDGDTPIMVGNLLIKTGDKVRDMKPVMKDIWNDMRWAVYQNIESGGRRGGGSWKKLTEYTQIKKGNADFFWTSGARSGYSSIGGDALVKSVTQDKARFQVKIITDTEVQLGTKRPYARTHQFGSNPRYTDKGKSTGSVPARPFLKFARYDIEKWDRWITEKLMEDIGAK